MKKLVRIYSNDKGSWWRPNYCGYTDDITKAGIFEYEDAIKHYPKMSYDTHCKDYFVDVTPELIKNDIDKLKCEIDKLKDSINIIQDKIQDFQNILDEIDL